MFAMKSEHLLKGKSCSLLLNFSAEVKPYRRAKEGKRPRGRIKKTGRNIKGDNEEACFE